MNDEHLAPVRQERDRIHGVAVFLVIMAVAGFAALCVLASWALWRSNTAAFQATGTPAQRAPGEMPQSIQGINLTLIDSDSSTEMLFAERRRHLDGHRWIDEGEGVAQIPIEAAMQAIAAGAVP